MFRSADVIRKGVPVPADKLGDKRLEALVCGICAAWVIYKLIDNGIAAPLLVGTLIRSVILGKKVLIGDYQLKAINDVHKAWAAGFRRPCVVMPCGAGKSVIVADIRSVRRQTVCTMPMSQRVMSTP